MIEPRRGGSARKKTHEGKGVEKNHRVFPPVSCAGVCHEVVKKKESGKKIFRVFSAIRESRFRSVSRTYS